MSRTVKVTVTAKDIRDGKHDSCTHCAGYRAIKRAFPRARVTCLIHQCSINGKCHMIPYKAANRLSRLFNATYANRKSRIRPFTFTLRLP